jgi:hypothetical protein
MMKLLFLVGLVIIISLGILSLLVMIYYITRTLIFRKTLKIYDLTVMRHKRKLCIGMVIDIHYSYKKKYCVILIEEDQIECSVNKLFPIKLY